MATKDPTAERWLPVVGWKGLYEVSDLGRVRSLGRTNRNRIYIGRIMRQDLLPNGYLRIGLRRHSGAQERLSVHRVVLSSFVRPPLTGEQADHLNFIKTDNRLVNLQWVVPKENSRRARAAQRAVVPKGEGHWRAKYTEAQVREIRQRVESGEAKAKLAVEFGACEASIYMIVNRERWAHVT